MCTSRHHREFNAQDTILLGQSEPHTVGDLKECRYVNGWTSQVLTIGMRCPNKDASSEALLPHAHETGLHVEPTGCT